MIKIDVVSGFLGAGKTTFIKKILKACADNNEQVVLIENEFGQIAIDGDQVRREGFTVYEISQGCVCCSLIHDFTYTLGEILTKIKPERVIFEPSGIFMLGEIFEIVKNSDIAKAYYLNSVITIIDSVNYIDQNQKYTSFFENQIQYADTLILSKSQFINEASITKIVTDLKNINENANVVTEDWNTFNNVNILNLIDRDLRGHLDNLIQQVECQECASHGNDDRLHHVRHQSFQSFGLTNIRIFAHDELKNILEALKGEEYGDIIRGKGFIRTVKGIYEFSYVFGYYTITEVFHEPSVMVCFIGDSLNKEKLSNLFMG